MDELLVKIMRVTFCHLEAVDASSQRAVRVGEKM